MLEVETILDLILYLYGLVVFVNEYYIISP